MWWTPARRRGVEVMDDPATPAELRDRGMAELLRSNRLFGGTRSALLAMRSVIPRLPPSATILDVGTGLADIPERIQREARQAGVTLHALGLDVSETLMRAVKGRLAGVVVGHALCLPLADRSVDVVTCSQVLHHFDDDNARRVVAELHRVSRGWVIVSDLRRSWLAAGGFWLASVALRFHSVTRHDGVASVLRGFTPSELASLVSDAVGVRPAIRGRAFWRLSATWSRSER